MVEDRLPDHLTGLDIVGVTKGEGKIRWTVYFRKGDHFTQSHTRRDNIGYHASPGPHLFFGNVNSHNLDALWKQAENARAGAGRRAIQVYYLQSLRKVYLGDTPRPIQVKSPPVNQNPEGLQLLEIWQHSIHESRSALVNVSLEEANILIAEMRARSGTKLGPHPNTGEYYFAEAVGEDA